MNIRLLFVFIHSAASAIKKMKKHRKVIKMVCSILIRTDLWLRSSIIVFSWLDQPALKTDVPISKNLKNLDTGYSTRHFNHSPVFFHFSGDLEGEALEKQSQKIRKYSLIHLMHTDLKLVSVLKSIHFQNFFEFRPVEGADTIV